MGRKIAQIVFIPFIRKGFKIFMAIIGSFDKSVFFSEFFSGIWSFLLVYKFSVVDRYGNVKKERPLS